MKSIGKRWFALLVIAGLFAECHKSNLDEDGHNHSLLTKSLTQIRAETAG